jgi:hypothetical protein
MLTPTRLTDPDSANILLDRYSSDFDYALSAVNTEASNPDNIAPTSYKDVYDIPHNFSQAWNHPQKWQRSKWRAAVKLELDKMAQYEVWQVVQIQRIPVNCRCVKHKWIFDIKRNGTFRSRLVACGYSQIPGVDFLEA